MTEFHFIRPLWLLTLLPCAALLAWYYFGRRRGGLWTGYVEPQLWRHVLAGRDERRRLLPLLLTVLATVLCVLALAGPAWQRLPQPVFKNQNALVVALDLSSSMDSQDIKPSRLQRARHKLLDILERRREGQTALIVYAGAAFAVTPLTDDVNTIRAQVPDLETRLMPAQGSRPDLAIEKALELLAQGGVQRGHLLLITDHADPDLLAPMRERLLGAGHGFSMLGVGTVEGAPIPAPGGGFLKDRNGAIVIARLNESELRRLGPYRRLGVDDSDIDYLLPDSNPQLLADTGRETGLKTDTWRDEGFWLLPPLLLLTVLAFRRGLLLWLCAPLLMLTLSWTPPARAFGWEDLWLNGNQQARRAFEEEQYETAQRLFNDPEWRAASAYRRGDYQTAADLLAEATSADALYNRGNALARLNRTGEAIESYNRALELEPRHADARHNRDLLLQQQQQQQQQNGNDQSGQQEQQQNPQAQQNQQPSDGQPEQAQQNPENPGEQTPPRQQQQQSAQDREQQQSQDRDSEAREQEHGRDRPSQTAAETAADEPDPERENMEQWLRRVPDDPGGLLKRKFQYQYRKQQQEQTKQTPSEREPW
jgi:Ca-activated chloride channel homolog